MATFLIGHGMDTEQMTFVPNGVTLKYYAELGEMLYTTNSLTLLASGTADGQSIQPRSTYVGAPFVEGNPNEESLIPNYSMAPDSLEEQQTELSAYEAGYGDGDILIFYGLETGWEGLEYLCRSPDECLAARTHTCGGILQVIQQKVAAEEIDDVIHVLACRAPEGGTKSTFFLEKPWQDPAAAVRKAKGDLDANAFMLRLKADPDGAEKALTALEQSTDPEDRQELAQLMSYPTIVNFSTIRYAQRLAKDYGAFHYRRFFESPQQAQVRDILASDKTLNRHLQKVEETLTAFFALSPEDKRTWWDSVDPSIQDSMCVWNPSIALWWKNAQEGAGDVKVPDINLLNQETVQRLADKSDELQQAYLDQAGPYVIITADGVLPEELRNILKEPWKYSGDSSKKSNRLQSTVNFLPGGRLFLRYVPLPPKNVAAALDTVRFALRGIPLVTDVVLNKEIAAIGDFGLGDVNMLALTAHNTTMLQEIQGLMAGGKHFVQLGDLIVIGNPGDDDLKRLQKKLEKNEARVTGTVVAKGSKVLVSYRQNPYLLADFKVFRSFMQPLLKRGKTIALKR